MTRRSPLCSVVAAFDGMTSSLAAGPPDDRMGLGALRPAVETGGAEEVALAAMRERHLAVEDFVFAHHAEAAAERAGAAGIRPERDPVDADRRLHLHGFGRQVHAVRGVGFDDVDAVQAGAGAAAAGDQLADDVAAAAWMASAEGDDQKFARGRCRHAVGQDLGERADHAAGDALDGGGPGVDGGRFLRIDDRALGQAQLDGPEAAAVGRDGGVGERPHGVARRRQRAGRHAIQRPLHLRTGAFEVELDVAALYRDGDLDADRLVELDAVIVEVIDEPIGALGDGCEAPCGSSSPTVAAARRRSRPVDCGRSRRRAPPAGAPPPCRPRPGH